MNQLRPVDATVSIVPWPDPVIDNLGHDPRSHYVESYWLAILGPSTTWLLRRLASGLEKQPEGFELELQDTACGLGLGHKGGSNSPFMRTLRRCITFDLAQVRGDSELAVRRHLPPLTRRQVSHLPDSLRRSHELWLQEQLRGPSVDQVRRRARQLALSLLELGEDTESSERQLMRWRFHPAMAREASVWAWQRHSHALEASRPG